MAILEIFICDEESRRRMKEGEKEKKKEKINKEGTNTRANPWEEEVNGFHAT